MLIKLRDAADPLPSEITPKEVFLDRRRFMQAAAAAGGFTLMQGLLPSHAEAAGAKLQNVVKSKYSTPEKMTSYEAVTTHNNFYEFGTGKDDPARYSDSFHPKPWKVEIAGHAAKTGTFDFDDFIKPYQLEERIYRLRCVEAWSMVIPWVGFPLADVIKRFEPTSKAKFVAFETVVRPKEMRGQNFPILPWPYVEGLRMDEAMNPLTILAVGLYGEEMPNPNGAPIRLVVPWKYGFKSIKSIVKISFVEDQPPATWNEQAPHEYGFYSNVNPNRDHPRWSQASERRITGQSNFSALFTPKIETQMFNGYGEQVADLYKGMDLMKLF